MNHNRHTRRTWDEYCPHWTISTYHLPRWYFVFPFYYYNEIPGQLIVKRKDLFGLWSVIIWQHIMAEVDGNKTAHGQEGEEYKKDFVSQNLWTYARWWLFKRFHCLLAVPLGETKAFVTKTWECGLGCLITKLWHHCRTFWVPWRIIQNRVLHKY